MAEASRLKFDSAPFTVTVAPMLGVGPGDYALLPRSSVGAPCGHRPCCSLQCLLRCSLLLLLTLCYNANARKQPDSRKKRPRNTYACNDKREDGAAEARWASSCNNEQAPIVHGARCRNRADRSEWIRVDQSGSGLFLAGGGRIHPDPL